MAVTPTTRCLLMQFILSATSAEPSSLSSGSAHRAPVLLRIHLVSHKLLLILLAAQFLIEDHLGDLGNRLVHFPLQWLRVTRYPRPLRAPFKCASGGLWQFMRPATCAG
ncbi:hypothetical protein QC762_0023320 [Podospora pseudocomata]|uniref:Secreted protein n=1 Tax=Podospora pseudocomata TaxID=2093779 RepID=A0ABR0GZ09_9PEZI|nr:hypothetical protein QC762_0023320 [Podospora pseudocomata]